MVNRYDTGIIKEYTSKNINRLVEEVDEVGGFRKYNKTLTVRQKNGIITKWFGTRSRIVDFIEYCKVPDGVVNTAYDIYALTKDEIGIAKYDIYENNTISNLELYTTMINEEGEPCSE